MTANFTDSAGLRHSATSPVSTSTVENQNDPAVGLSLAYTGSPAGPPIGTLLRATPISDADGVEDVVFTYTWTRSTDPAVPAGSTVLGSTSNAYTTTAADAGSYIRVTVTYTDNLGTAETATAVLEAPVVGATP
ncbi:hypothetical protein [Agrococcus sp. Marseille-Q4369]|uniref:hypothetical protein n=1 Tax=Agrococcus sp. Marseille-Q4369 TaxID=2810513 RepID=UPI001B8D8C92|nr:hypothetical protein [Agrococcus sp. Marseille-Q4369]QUW19411.1 hypothetical protein JSQ78_03555 [Agrococcus sp. Marseille-Q4369]